MLTSAAPGIVLALQIAVREMRGGLRGFYVLTACIALGVMAVAGVSSVASGLANGLAREGRTMLGGDVAFLLSLREATGPEQAFLQTQGQVSRAATMRAMARTPGGDTALVELKAVDGSYPLYGTVVLDPDQPLRNVLRLENGVFGAAADPALLARLGLGAGSRIKIGAADIEIRAALKSEPDKLAGGIGFGPRLLLSDAALRASGLLRPGSVVRWHYRLRLPGADESEAPLRAVTAAARAQFPEAGWEIRSRANASPALAQNLDRFTQYLTLVGLSALLIGGVGVANAAKAHLDRRREAIATLKCLGATGSRVFAIYLVQIWAFAALGAIPGLLVGAALPYLVVWGFASILPLPIEPVLHAGDLTLAFLYGLLTATVFALWPLGRAHDVPVSALFRSEISGYWRRPRTRYVVATALCATGLAALALVLAYDRRIAAVYIVAAAAVLVLLYALARLLMLAARSIVRLRVPVARLAMANIHRPGALTPSVVLSLGLGLTLLVMVVGIDGNLRRQFLAALPDQAPSFYFIDIPVADAAKFDAFVRANAPGATLNEVPMLRGRIVAANGIPAEELKPAPEAAWALQSDRGITYAQDLPPGSRLVAGRWWGPDYQGAPLVSFEQRIADGLGLKIGDVVTVNVLGRNIVATIANLRTVDWQSLGINFVMVFAPATFRGAPHTRIATLTYPPGRSTEEESMLLKAVGKAFPGIAAMRVRDVLDAVGATVTNLALGIRAASALTLIVAILVLAGALAAGHRRRVYEAVILKTLGATRMRLVGVYAIEYLVLGVATALLALAAGTAAAAIILRHFMHLPFLWLPEAPLAACVLVVLFVVALGLAGTARALGQKPAPLLRDL
ncbi:MAG TPA: FtsX-like permease family protein [Xanthobacteraceae bacterium]|jgi:putative ABC transport system permease protein